MARFRSPIVRRTTVERELKAYRRRLIQTLRAHRTSLVLLDQCVIENSKMGPVLILGDNALIHSNYIGVVPPEEGNDDGR